MMGRVWNMSEEGKAKIRAAKIGKLNPQYGKRNEKSMHWKGNKVGYYGIHDWLTANYGQPKFCEVCERTDDNTRYEWAKITKYYQRQRSAFKRMCKKCHNDYDGVNVWQQSRG